MEFSQLKELIKSVSDAKLSAFTYEEEGLKITMTAEKEAVPVSAIPQPAAAPAVNPAAAEPVSMEEKAEAERAGKVIKSPLVGTFYSAPSEDAGDFVKVGDAVKKGQTVAIVEAMKLMNEIESEFDGEIKEILVENGRPVEYGQPLFILQ